MLPSDSDLRPARARPAAALSLHREMAARRRRACGRWARGAGKGSGSVWTVWRVGVREQSCAVRHSQPVYSPGVSLCAAASHPRATRYPPCGGARVRRPSPRRAAHAQHVAPHALTLASSAVDYSREPHGIRVRAGTRARSAQAHARTRHGGMHRNDRPRALSATHRFFHSPPYW